MARKDRVQPTHYPVLLFHAIRSAQLVCSLVVASIIAYFLRELVLDRYRLPWTFILLFAVSLLTILSLSATIALHCCYGLNPVLNALLNTLLAVLWAVSFALLSWWTSGTLRHVCNRESWVDGTGVSVCRTYKALFSFSLFALVATVLALLLDVHVQRGATRRGKFSRLQLGEVDAKTHVTVERVHGGESNPNPVARAGKWQRGGRGYEVPQEQFDHEQETGYEGAAGQGNRSSVEERDLGV